MATIQEHREVSASFQLKIAEVAKLSLLSGSYTKKFTNDYANERVTLSVDQASGSVDLSQAVPEDLLEEMQAHIRFIDCLIQLKLAYDNPANNPRQIEVIRQAKDHVAKKASSQLLPCIKKMLQHALKAVERPLDDYPKWQVPRVMRTEIFNFLSNSMRDTTALANTINNPLDMDRPAKLKKLIQNCKHISRGKIAKACLNNPSLNSFFIGLIGAATIFLAIGSILVTCLAFGPIGIPAGAAMLTASVSFGILSNKLIKISDAQVTKSQVKGHLADYADSVKKLVKSDHFYDAFAKSEAALAKLSRVRILDNSEHFSSEERKPILPYRK